jgi:ribonuclease P protein component
VRTGAKVRAKLLDLRRLEPADGTFRVAIVVGKFGFSAVARNQLKRRLRELVRLYMLPALPPMDLLVRARRDTYAATYAMLHDEVSAVIARLKGTESN